MVGKVNDSQRVNILVGVLRTHECCVTDKDGKWSDRRSLFLLVLLEKFTVIFDQFNSFDRGDSKI